MESLRIWDTGTADVPGSLFGNRLFFQGRELDPVTGLYDFRNRWYDPEMGRFVSRDPSGYPDGPNQYAAFLADPANLSDPFGLDAAGVTVTPDSDTWLRELSEDEFVNQLRLSGISPAEWDGYLRRAGYTGSTLRRSRALVTQLANDLAPVEDALMVASVPIVATGVAMAGPQLVALATRSAAAANEGSFALLSLGARVAPRTTAILTGSGAMGTYLALSDAPAVPTTAPRLLLTSGNPTTRTLQQVRALRGADRWRAGELYAHELLGGERNVHFAVPMAEDITTAGGRFVDEAVSSGSRVVANEVKTYLRWRTVQGVPVQGSVPLSPHVQQQVLKDAWLMRNIPGYDPRWLFLDAPPSPELADLLRKKGITFVVY